MRYLVDNPGPSYLRLGKAGEPVFHLSPPEVSRGCWIRVRNGNEERVLLTTGAVLQIAMERIEQSHFAIYSMPLWSMADKVAQAHALRTRSHVMTIEDHLFDGGFGSWLLEARSADQTLACVVSNIALNSEVCGTVGTQATLNRLGGLTT